mmetsp:Transcript_44862/g.108431  ORF Transcript_44862/g.108431 Transcript_44862/m.108431 type:complete len:119 (-) Transcript_44862:1438-1794(-)
MAGPMRERNLAFGNTGWIFGTFNQIFSYMYRIPKTWMGMATFPMGAKPRPPTFIDCTPSGTSLNMPMCRVRESSRIQQFVILPLYVAWTGTLTPPSVIFVNMRSKKSVFENRYYLTSV